MKTNLDIVSWLAKEGFSPVKSTGSKAWYISPLRPDEKKASFCVDTSRNTWVDWSDFKRLSGDLVWLVRVMYNLDKESALKHISGRSMGVSEAHIQPPKPREEKIRVTGVEDLGRDPDSVKLINYIQGRGIPFSIAKKYVKKVYFQFRKHNTWDTEKYAVGFKNDMGGWELRNGAGIKHCIPPKTITTIEGIGERCRMFGGFFNFLSAKAIFKDYFFENAVILNSISFRVQRDNWKHYKEIEMYLDNNENEKKAMRYIGEVCNIRDMSYFYKDYEDLNDYLKDKK